MGGHTLVRRAIAAVGAVALIASFAACGAKEQALTAPSGTPNSPVPPTPGPGPAPTPPAGTGVSLTGYVFEIAPTGGLRPVSNLRLRVLAASSQNGATGGAALPDVITDGSGRYEINGVTTEAVFVSSAPGSTHRFLCDQYPIHAAFPYNIDLPVVPASWSGDQLPPGMWTTGTSVYGTVSERVGNTLRPVAGATVTLDNGTPDPAATTNANGLYMVCSVVRRDQTRTVTARRTGYNEASQQITGGWELRVDLQLTRQ